MSVVDQVTAVVAPLVATAGVELVDIEHAGAVVRVLVDEPGGIGLERIAGLTQAISQALDASDPLPGRYTLEVSSPGVERPLRTPRHFLAAVGQKVNIRVVDQVGARRLSGTLVAADESGVRLSVPGPDEGTSTEYALDYAHIERARTVFEWGPAPKPGKGSKPGAGKKRASKVGQP